MFSHKSRLIWLFVILISCFLFNSPTSAQEVETEEPVVHAVLFYSPSCPHCHEAINNVIIPLMEEYGEQLVVIGIDTSTEVGGALFGKAIVYYETPENRRGVPTLIVEDTVMVSTLEIENTFPGMIEAGLSAGGNDWPSFPGLTEIVAEAAATSEAAPEEEIVPTDAATIEPESVVVAEAETAVPLPTATLAIQATETPFSVAQALESIDTTTMADAEPAPPPDPIGFALGWLVLLGLVAVLLFTVWQLGGNWHTVTQATGSLADNKGRSLLFWGLTVIGLIVSGYLAYVETTQITAVCGPVGECNIVQASPYAQILGIPVAVFGVLFYLTVAGMWLLQRSEKTGHLAILALIALTILGTLFSMYLTLVELLVIGAICMWCLTSAVVTGLLCLLVTRGVVTQTGNGLG